MSRKLGGTKNETFPPNKFSRDATRLAHISGNFNISLPYHDSYLDNRTLQIARSKLQAATSHIPFDGFPFPKFLTWVDEFIVIFRRPIQLPFSKQ